MVNKTIPIIAIVVIVIIAAAGAAVLLQQNANTPAPSATPTQPPTVDIAHATSMAFSVNDTSQGVTTTYKFVAADLNTANMALRVEVPGCDTGLNYTYILHANGQTAVSKVNDGAWTAENFSRQWPLWSNMFSDYKAQLETRNSIAPYSYTATNGDPTLIFDVTVNPTIPASTFQTT